MSCFRKFLARFVVTVTVVAAALVGVSGPAEAWKYCNQTLYLSSVNMYDRQVYCGTTWLRQPGIIIGVCESLYATNPNNNVSAAYNVAGRAVTFYVSTDCSGAGYYLPSGNSHPNFCVLTVGCETVSSLKWS